MHVPFSCKKVKLLLGEVRVDHSKWNAMERGIPCSKERIFPRIRHRKDIVQIHVFPIGVANSFSSFWRWWLARITISPLIPYEVVMLFRPQHAGQSLSLDVSEIVIHRQRAYSPKELVSLSPSLLDDIVQQFFVQIAVESARQSEPYDCAFSWWYSVAVIESIPSCALCAMTSWIYRTLLFVHYPSMEGIFDIWLLILASIQGLDVGFIFGEHQLGLNVFSVRTTPWRWG